MKYLVSLAIIMCTTITFPTELDARRARVVNRTVLIPYLEIRDLPTFDQEVLKSDQFIVIAFFGHQGCSCKRNRLPWKNLASQYQSMKFVEVKTETLTSLAQGYHVKEYPTFLIMKEGKVLQRIIGSNYERLLGEAIQKTLALHPFFKTPTEQNNQPPLHE